MRNYVLAPLLFICLGFALHVSADAQTAEEYFERGQKLAREGDLRDAVKNYKQAIRLDSKKIASDANIFSDHQTQSLV